MRLTVFCLTAQISPEPGVTTISIRLGVGLPLPEGGGDSDYFALTNLRRSIPDGVNPAVMIPGHFADVLNR